jgi:siroheme synthase
VVYPVTVVGAGPGSEKYILPLAWGVVEEADLLVGGESALSIFEAAGKEKIRIRGDLQGITANLSPSSLHNSELDLITTSIEKEKAMKPNPYLQVGKGTSWPC